MALIFSLQSFFNLSRSRWNVATEAEENEHTGVVNGWWACTQEVRNTEQRRVHATPAHLYLGTITGAKDMKHWPCSGDCSHSYSFWCQALVVEGGSLLPLHRQYSLLPTPDSYQSWAALHGLLSWVNAQSWLQVKRANGFWNSLLLTSRKFIPLHWTWPNLTGGYYNHSSSDLTLHRKKLLRAVTYHSF